jgi:hypothetical protein
MWSYPIVNDGLIYVVDLRNCLYVLEYTGAFAKEVDKITFLGATRTRATRSVAGRWAARPPTATDT